jgi:uracil-DNA glycosylase
MNAESILKEVAGQVAECKRCQLNFSRKRAVPGEGPARAQIMFIGEGPGFYESEQGRPFVGPSGSFLDELLEKAGVSRKVVFITNVVKCRPPGNRTPEADEVTACLPYLEQQIRLLKPKVICSLGNTPLRALMGNDKLGITRMRGQTLDWHGFVLIPTFHPSYLLRNETAKKPCWEDLLAVLKALGRTPPPRKATTA